MIVIRYLLRLIINFCLGIFIMSYMARYLYPSDYGDLLPFYTNIKIAIIGIASLLYSFSTIWSRMSLVLIMSTLLPIIGIKICNLAVWSTKVVIDNNIPYAWIANDPQIYLWIITIGLFLGLLVFLEEEPNGRCWI